MEKKEYEVEVTVHEQVTRAHTMKVKVRAYTPGAARAVAEGEAEKIAKEDKEGVPFIEWSEPSYHYESESHQTEELS